MREVLYSKYIKKIILPCIACGRVERVSAQPAGKAQGKKDQDEQSRKIHASSIHSPPSLQGTFLGRYIYLYFIVI